MENRKKVYITGTSRGIGLELKSLPFDVKGTTRSDGFDIEKDYEKVLSSILESNSDVFINNAYSPKYQTKLLVDVFEKWKYLDKQIINIGSCASDMDLDNLDRKKEYPANKIDQSEIIRKINVDYCRTGYKENEKCRVTNLKMGYVLTEFPSLYDKRLFPTLEVSRVKNIIEWIINQPADMCVREISLHATSKPILENI